MMNALEQFARQVSDRKAIIFIGAGLSKIAGCSGWDGLANELLDEIVKFDEGASKIKEQNIDSIEKITYCKKVLLENSKRTTFDGIVRKCIMPNYAKAVRDYLPIITELKKINPFPPIVTTNLDNCLEGTGLFDMVKIFYEIPDFSEDNLNQDNCIFHIHGYIENFKKGIWEIDEYVDRYKDSGFCNFIGKIFSRYSVLFLGYSLNDQKLKDLISIGGRKSSHFHYALMPSSECLSEEILSKIYKIKIIRYGAIEEFSAYIKRWINADYDPVSNMLPRDDGDR